MTDMSLSDVVHGSPHGPRRRSQRAAEKRRKRRRRRTWVTAVILVAGIWRSVRRRPHPQVPSADPTTAGVP